MHKLFRLSNSVIDHRQLVCYDIILRELREIIKKIATEYTLGKGQIFEIILELRDVDC